MKENIVLILRRTLYGVLFLLGVILPTMLSILLIVFVLIPLSGVVWIFTGKSYYQSLMNIPDKFSIVNDFLIKLLKVNNERKY